MATLFVFGLIMLAFLGFVGWLVLGGRAYDSDPWLIRKVRGLGPTVDGLCGVTSIVAVLVIVSSPYYIEYPTGEGAIVVFNDRGDVERVSDRAVFCVSRCANVVRRTTRQSSVTPITDNPKARHLVYKVDVEIVNWGKFFDSTGVRLTNGRIPDAGENQKRLNTDVSYELAEFNEANSRELARFYNPWDAKQQRDLEAMLRAYLEPHLATRGIRFVRLQSFSVE